MFNAIFGSDVKGRDDSLNQDPAKREGLLYKSKGNSFFKEKNYKEALKYMMHGAKLLPNTLQEYSLGIEKFPVDENGKPAVIIERHENNSESFEENILAVLYSNRSATLSILGRYSSALDDSENCILLERNWSKGYVRKAKALMGLGQYKQAAMIYSKAIEMENRSRKQEKAAYEKDIEVLKQQNQANNRAYLDLMDKNKMLQQQLEDYNLVFGSAGKKNA